MIILILHLAVMMEKWGPIDGQHAGINDTIRNNGVSVLGVIHSGDSNRVVVCICDYDSHSSTLEGEWGTEGSQSIVSMHGISATSLNFRIIYKENQWSTVRIVCCMLMSIIGTCRQMLMNKCIELC